MFTANKTLFANNALKVAAFFVALVFIVAVLSNALSLGGREIVELLNTLSSAFFALVTAALALRYLLQLEQNNPSKRVYLFLTIGLGLWAAAEIIWAVLSLANQEIPYPSIADALWIPGYFFVFAALYLLFNSLKAAPSPSSTTLILGSYGLFFILVSIFVLIPLINEQVPADRLLEKMLNVFYPIGDLTILLGASLVALALAGGAFSWAWAFIAFGIFCLTFSDTLFVYADWNGLYYPENTLNFITVLVDTTNLLCYMAIAYGIFIQIQFALNDIEEPIDIRRKLIYSRENTTDRFVKITLFTDARHHLISANPMLVSLLHRGKELPDMVGRPLNQVLNFDYERTQEIMRHISRDGFLNKQIVNLTNAEGQPVAATISGIADFDEQNRYVGADLILTVRLKPSDVQPEDDLDAIRQNIEKVIEQLHQRNAGFDGSEEELKGKPTRGEDLTERLLAAFFVTKIHALHVTVSRLSGYNVAKSMQRMFNTAAARLECKVHMDGPNVVFDERPCAIDVYRDLLKIIINYAIAVTSLDIIKRTVDKIDDSLDEETVLEGKKAGLFGLAQEG